LNETDCVFCKIVEGKIPSFKIFEDDNYLAFLDISQFTEGHTLVIPKKHYRFVWDIEDVDGYFSFVKKIAEHYKNDLSFKYVDSLIFGRLVPHAHTHLLPHNGDDKTWDKALEGLEYFHNPDRKLTTENGNNIVNEFKI